MNELKQILTLHRKGKTTPKRYYQIKILIYLYTNLKNK